MPKLLAIEGQDEVSISGIGDIGPEVVIFYSEEGAEVEFAPDLRFDKKEFKTYADFQAYIGERMPEYIFLEDRPDVNSLNYDDLIDICDEKFPDLMYDDDESPYDDSELQGKGENAGEESPQKNKLTNLPKKEPVEEEPESEDKEEAWEEEEEETEPEEEEKTEEETEPEEEPEVEEEPPPKEKSELEEKSKEKKSSVKSSKAKLKQLRI